MATFFSENSEDCKTFFYCKDCDYKCYKKQHIKQHFLTIRHKNKIGNKVENSVKNGNLEKKFECQCGKSYVDKSGLWKHTKKCTIHYTIFGNDDNKSEKFLQDLIFEMVKSNTDLQKNIIEMCKQMQPINVNNTNNTNNINNSKSFNINFFLNETCKNAMNIMDFANSIQLNLTDLEKMGELGYVEGISKIIIDNLKLLDVTERPVHCSNLKKDVLYVKDQDRWEKENIDNAKIKKVINCITNKNISLIPQWKKENPDCIYSSSNKSNIINRIIMETMETDKSKHDKIIKNIAKEVIINK
jgi:hypothetical protein